RGIGEPEACQILTRGCGGGEEQQRGAEHGGPPAWERAASPYHTASNGAYSAVALNLQLRSTRWNSRRDRSRRRRGSALRLEPARERMLMPFPRRFNVTIQPRREADARLHRVCRVHRGTASRYPSPASSNAAPAPVRQITSTSTALLRQ